MPKINDSLVQQRLITVIEVLQDAGEFLEPEDVINIFNEFGLFIIDTESAMADMSRNKDGSTETNFFLH